MHNLYVEVLISTSLHIGNMKGGNIRFEIYLKFKVKDFSSLYTEAVLFSRIIFPGFSFFTIKMSVIFLFAEV